MVLLVSFGHLSKGWWCHTFCGLGHVGFPLGFGSLLFFELFDGFVWLSFPAWYFLCCFIFELILVLMVMLVHAEGMIPLTVR